MIKQNYDKILLGIALIILAVAFIFAAIRPEVRPATELVDIVPLQERNTYQVSELAEPDLTIPEWEAPEPQAAGEEWVFDLFTPPNIAYHPGTGTFIVEGVGPDRPEPFGLQLVGMEERLYRIQLVGYHGKPGDYLLNLRDEERRADILAREGRDYPELEISVRKVEVVTRLIEHEGETKVPERFARAVIFDHRLGREVVLESDKPKKAEGRAARFRVTLEGHEGEEVVAHEGDTFQIGDFTYEVVELEASTATVSRRSPDPDEPMRTERLGAERIERVPADEPVEDSNLEAAGADRAEPAAIGSGDTESEAGDDAPADKAF